MKSDMDDLMPHEDKICADPADIAAMFGAKVKV